MFNRAALASNEVILAESLIDAMTFWSAGWRHVTSSYGAGGFTAELLEALVEHGVERVLIAYDRDDAGDKGAASVAKQLAARGIGAYRVKFPKGMDANQYAQTVRPATKSLGAMLRAAEWMAGGSALHRDVLMDWPAPVLPPPEPAAPPETHLPSAAEIETTPPIEDDLPEPTTASPVPPGPSAEASAATEAVTQAEVGDRDVVIRLGDRTWRARGLSRNPSAESLRVNLMVRRPCEGGDLFHVDGLELLSAKARGAFVAEAAAEMGVVPETIKRDLGLVLLKLEAVQEERLEAARTAEAKTGPVMTATDEAAALAWLKRPDLLDRIAADIASCGVVGEAENALTVYLAALSRKLDRPLAVLIQSTSAAGKSALMDAVMDLIPQEERVAYSAMTGQSLFYLGEADLKHKALAIAEEEGARHAGYALKLLQSQGTLTIASTGKDPATGKLVTQDYTVEGPVALMMTTTAIDLDEELRNRCLVLTIDESREQTRAIHACQRFEETLEGLRGRQDQAAIRTLHQNAQRLLKPLKVVNPFAERLTFLDDQTRTRRDHRKYLGLIRAIALLHQHQRPIRTLARPEGGEPVLYIEATVADIAMANRLAHAVLGTTLDELPPQTRRLLALIRTWAEDRATAEVVKPRDLRFTRREVREATGWGDTQLKVHLRRLEELEYLLTRRDGTRLVYELAWGGEGGDGAAFVMGLIDPAGLEAEPDDQTANEWRYDGDRAGRTHDPAGSGRPPVGGWSGGGRDAEHGPEPRLGGPSSLVASIPPENPHQGLNGAAVVASSPSYAPLAAGARA